MQEPAKTPAPDEDGFDRLLGFLCALPLAFIVALTFVDVFARYLFSSPIRGSVEMVEFAMALAIFTAMPLVTRHRAHVTVSMIDGLVQGRRGDVKRLFCDALSTLALALMAWRLAVHAAGDHEANTRTIVLAWPQAPLTWTMAILAALSAMVVIARMASDFHALRKPREKLA